MASNSTSYFKLFWSLTLAFLIYIVYLSVVTSATGPPSPGTGSAKPRTEVLSTCDASWLKAGVDAYPTCPRNPLRRWTNIGPCAVPHPSGRFCVFAAGNFASPEDAAVAVVTTPAKAAIIASLPAFSRTDNVVRMPVHEESKAYRIEEVPGKGLGLVATRRLNRGDLILAETPALVVDHADAFYGELNWMERSLLLKGALGYLPNGTRQEVMDLEHHSEMSGDGRIGGILVTNAFVSKMDDDDKRLEFAMIYPESECILASDESRGRGTVC